MNFLFCRSWAKQPMFMKSSVFVLGVLEIPAKSFDTDRTGVGGNDVTSDWDVCFHERGHCNTSSDEYLYRVCCLTF